MHILQRLFSAGLKGRRDLLCDRGKRKREEYLIYPYFQADTAAGKTGYGRFTEGKK
jgi:hypothetical protein